MISQIKKLIESLKNKAQALSERLKNLWKKIIKIENQHKKFKY